MKKVYTLLLMIIVVTMSMSLIVRADVATYYSMNINEGYKYNLTSGILEQDQGFATTSKILLKSTTLRISSDTFTYLYVYSKTNEYLGFYTTQYSVLEAQSLPNHLGEIGTGPVLLEAGSNSIAIAIQISAFNKEIDTIMPTLNNRSLRYVFETNDMLDETFIIEDPNGINLPDYFTVDMQSYIHLEFLNEGYNEWEINMPTGIDIHTHSFYISFTYQIDNLLYYYNQLYITDMSTNSNLLIDVGDVGDIFTTYDTIMVMPFDVSDYYLRLTIGHETSLVINILTYGSVIIDLDVLNITSLTENQITSYLEDYVEGKKYEPTDVLSLASFDLIQPYYLGEDIPEDEDYSPESLIDRFLTWVGWNNDMAKTIIAIVIMLLTVIGLALKKIPSIITISLVILEYLLFTYLGWTPGWIIIVFGILIVIIGYLRFKGGNAND